MDDCCCPDDDDADDDANVGGQVARSKVEQWTVVKAHRLKEPRNSSMFLVNLTISISFCQRNHLRMLMMISPVTLAGFGQVPTPRCPGKHTLYQYFVPEDGHLRLGWWCWAMKPREIHFFRWDLNFQWVLVFILGTKCPLVRSLDWSSDSWFLCKAHNDLQEGGLRRFNIIVSWWCKCWCHNLTLLIYNFSVRDGADRLWIYFFGFCMYTLEIERPFVVLWWQLRIRHFSWIPSWQRWSGGGR